MIDSFDELNKMAQELPGNVGLLKELKEDLNAVKPVELGRDEYLLGNYKTSVKNGQHEKVKKRIKKLGFGNIGETFLERRFQEKHTKQESSIEDLVMKEETVLVKGEAGAGKSSVAAKVMQER